jgi:formylglycine-generating enzyme required for sulfatase activity
VKLDAFWIDKYEVSQAQFQAVMKKNPSYYKGPSLPVETVSWQDATEYCQKIGKRLPTDAEWEVAARGGRSTYYPWGDQITGKEANFCDASCNFSLKVSTIDDGHSATAPVGSYPPNSYGVYDMAGNVSEWVADWFDESGASCRQSPVANPRGPTTAADKSTWWAFKYRVVRGGSWASLPHNIGPSHRWRKEPNEGNEDASNGFRCAVSAK